MADAAAETGDARMQSACERLFDNITQRQMYVTGAVGASPHHESFTVDYDLPSDRCYGETCASVAMAFFARRMLRLSAQGRYADLLELELYNAALAGMQLDGTKFFYVNPLMVDTSVSGQVPGYEHVLAQRPAWHACACCPPNLARLIASLGGYLWSETDDTVYSHLFIGSEAQTRFGRIRLDSAYPWQGSMTYRLEAAGHFTLAIRIPQYAKALCIRVNDRETACDICEGYAHLTRLWAEGDRVTVSFDMPVRRLHAHPRVRDAEGKVTLARGPLIYCVEEADHPLGVSSLVLPEQADIRTERCPDGVLQGMVLLHARAEAQLPSETLYHEETRYQPCELTAIPYFAWGNRGSGDMRVWIRHRPGTRAE